MLRKAWEISDKIKIQNVAFFDRQDIGGGWRGRVAAGHGLPPAGRGLPQVGRGHPPAGRGYPTSGRGHPPAGRGHPAAEESKDDNDTALEYQ